MNRPRSAPFTVQRSWSIRRVGPVPHRSKFRFCSLKAAHVRLWRRIHSGVKVPVRRNVHPPATEGYCVVATRGGELPEVNNPSVTT
jgi:hypothetical protein